MELKKIDLTKKSFIANGVEYFIESEISIQRAVYAEAAKIELETGMNVGKQTEEWKKVYDTCNENKFADVAVTAYNNLRSFKNFYEDHSPVLRLCACYINYKDEDRRYISDDLINKKVNDWIEEGFSISGFFLLSLSILKDEVKSCVSATQGILEAIREYNELMKDGSLNIPISV